VLLKVNSRDHRVLTWLKGQTARVKVLDAVFGQTHLLRPVTRRTGVFHLFMVRVHGTRRRIFTVARHFHQTILFQLWEMNQPKLAKHYLHNEVKLKGFERNETWDGPKEVCCIAYWINARERDHPCMHKERLITWFRPTRTTTTVPKSFSYKDYYLYIFTRVLSPKPLKTPINVDRAVAYELQIEHQTWEE
jgi:hypothetical protein